MCFGKPWNSLFLPQQKDFLSFGEKTNQRKVFFEFKPTFQSFKEIDSISHPAYDWEME